MDEVLTLAEIEARYDGEWVLIGDPEYDEQSRVVRGRVLSHSRNRDDLDRVDAELRPQSAAYLYLGEIPEDAVVVL
jgi:hypothetical protein